MDLKWNLTPDETANEATLYAASDEYGQRPLLQIKRVKASRKGHAPQWRVRDLREPLGPYLPIPDMGDQMSARYAAEAALKGTLA